MFLFFTSHLLVLFGNNGEINFSFLPGCWHGTLYHSVHLSRARNRSSYHLHFMDGLAIPILPQRHDFTILYMGNDNGQGFFVVYVASLPKQPTLANRFVCLDLPTNGTRHCRSAPRPASMRSSASGMGSFYPTKPMPPSDHLQDVDSDQFRYVEQYISHSQCG